MSTLFRFFGFSLVELMVVITIISILALMSFPSYQRYTQYARFTEAISATSLFKTAVSLALQQGIPRNEISNGQHGIPDPPKSTKNLTSIKVEKSIITATGSPLTNNATYILTPNDDGSEFTVSGTCLENGLCNA